MAAIVRTIGAEAERPRRMGLCSEVADDGGNLEDHPALANRYVRGTSSFQRARSTDEFLKRVEPFSCPPDKILAWDIASLGD
jgi:hypothetical protein